MSQEPFSDVMAQLDANLAIITSETPAAGFTKSGYRLLMGQEPDSAVDGLYFIDVPAILKQGATFGAAETIYEANVVVEVGYYRGGGDAGGGDRQTVMRAAADDVMRIADVLVNPANYGGSTTGIREIRFMGAERVLDKPHAEVWAVRLWVQWRSDLIVT